MAIGRKIVGGLERSLFVPGGRYYTETKTGKRKELREKLRQERVKSKSEKIKTKLEMKKQKKDWKMVEESLVLYKNAMETTGHLPPAERAKILKKVEDIIFERVKKTYNDNAEKQSLAHQKLYEMNAHLAMERMRLKK